MKKKIVTLTLVSALALSLAACGNTTQTTGEAPAAESASSAAESASSAAEDAASEAESAVSVAEEEVEATVETEEAAEEEAAAGFQEFPIWEDEEVGFLNVSGVYFQPVPMSGGNENYEDYDMHFEADVSAMENDLGFGVGDWVPYMTVTYDIIGSDGNSAASGTFMPMAASDGPHYGANIALPNADTYSVKLTFDIDESSYLIHLDDVTGPGGTLDQVFPLELELPDVWDYVPQEW